MSYLQTEPDIANAALDLVDEIHDVEEAQLMHRMIMYRFQTQPEAMAQIIMCLAFWVGGASSAVLDDTTSTLAIERCRQLLVAGKLSESEYMRVAS